MVTAYFKFSTIKKNNYQTHIVTIAMHESGQRIDNFLRTQLKGVPKSLIYRLVRQGQVRVNKNKIKPKYKLQSGDELRIPPVWKVDNKPLSPQLGKVAVLTKAILYEDDHLLILNKPAGTAVHSGSRLSFGVIEGLRALWPNAHFLELVHRLDRDTSGVLLVAKKRSALRFMHEQLRMKSIKKDYLALVRGQWPSHTQSVSAPLIKNILASGERIVRVSSDGKWSKTGFKVEERFTLATLVKVSPVTGRTHQIRVHSQYAGHPIAFDDRYGDRNFDQTLKSCGLNRLFLHAVALSFKHPASGETLRIEAPLDESLRNCLLYLRTYHKSKQ
ncbi:23S rRNA pseudouridine(955/2504/2580) synthase [Candidatus Palibaumannia cicadellinicola]|uniref:Pseudouridine synthase n=1 Tax=Candidatus Palibaumannia cicadellinicola TaxID=186490 RepID=A0A2N4XWT9_9GAMM|nr:23S rRNA pseudouridine(955/2504/2580) synthase RluC [Candidatus Baumannia cicadellinicola]PLK58613.1 23S rRNA pseudouridine(955/2504/2580) synthase [Candidatus Baumannia cicadellinicola]